MQTRHGVFSHFRGSAHCHCVSKHGIEQHVLHGRFFVLRAQHHRGHFRRGALYFVLDLDSAFDVSYWVRFHFLVNGGVSDRAVFCPDWAHDGRVKQFDTGWQSAENAAH
jgi:hypothetical protein